MCEQLNQSIDDFIPTDLHLQREHLEIRKTKTTDCRIHWEDYKSMRLTRAVIFETLRMATVVNGVLRKTTQDVEING